ncbi:MAG TPA: lipopolysaccharide heptosyltransferase II [Gammaproteobacteria bacterium]|nr:lipopolysaccharide heptosyltransferase II [Gammaproteobacteria bacterium]
MNSTPNPSPLTPHRILVVGPAWIGDMVMAQSLFVTLKQRFPDCEIDVLAPAWSKSLLARMPEVHAAHSMPLGHGEFGFGARRRLGHLLRGRYDQAIVMPRSWKSALVPLFAGIPRRTGYRGEWRYGLINDMRTLDKSVLTQTVQRYVALGLEQGDTLPPPIPHSALRVDTRNQNALLDKLALNRDRPVIAVMPGAEYGPSKRWPTDHFGDLAKRLVAAGKQVWVFGSTKEQPLGEEILRIAGRHVVNLCGETRLEDVIDLMSLAETAVTNDSGLMHIAAAVSIKVVALYGSSTPDYTPPLTDKAEIVYLHLDCSPCFRRECPFGHTNCLNHMSVDEVQRIIP